MADIPDRDEWEAFYAKDIAKKFRGIMELISKYLGDPPDINNVPEEVWEEVGTELRPFFMTNGEKIAVETAQRMMTETAIEVEWDLVNEAAVNWSRQHSFDLVKEIVDFRRGKLQEAVSSYFEDGLTIGELRERIGVYYSPVRAESIAITEVTRANSEGSQIVVGELRKQGIEMVPFWQTNNDAIVKECPICWPRHNKPIEDGVFPPGHPRCRCWPTYELPKVKR